MARFGKHLRAIWRLRCPRCLEGRLYRSGMVMHERCPVCDLPLVREEGYYIGSLYISYAIASLILGLGMLAGHLLLPDWDLGYLILIAAVLFLPFVPAVTRYSRVLWLHFDRWAWPGEN